MADRRPPAPGRAPRNAAPLALLLVVAAIGGGCGLAGPSFSTDGPCVVDGRAPGAYPALEAQIPRTIAGRAATSVDSGRNCTDKALGWFSSNHDVHELHFAGATWDEGNGSGVSIAVLALPDKPLPVTWAEEFYQAGAIAGKHTGNIETSHPTYPGAGTVYRLDTLNDLSFQTVVVWPDGPLARVVIVATQVGPTASKTVHDGRVAEAVGAAVLASEAAGASPAGGSPDDATPGGASPAPSEPVLPSPT
ncbi:MAG: hypothetical protein HY263_07555 [Chloroflexi bacterium]|nr:hypothetical protein [Chloroflexota bacterium]